MSTKKLALRAPVSVVCASTAYGPVAGLPVTTNATDPGPAGSTPNANVAVTVTGALPARIHGSVPPHPPPLQPLKDEPLSGAAVRVTTLPGAKLCTQVPGHVMPAGLLITEPEPVVTTLTSNPAEGEPQASFE